MAGNRNSGRRDGGPCTDNRLALDVRTLAQRGWLAPGTVLTLTWAGLAIAVKVRVEAHAVLLTRHTGQGMPGDFEHRVWLARTSCHFGSERPWWRCPSCGSRVALLYVAARTGFDCRRCADLAHRSQRESKSDRAIRRALKIRRRMGWPGGILNDVGKKPTRMHATTFYHLMNEHNEMALRVLETVGARIDVQTARVSAMVDSLPPHIRRSVRLAIR
jgi:hypothetical protein